MMSPDKTLGTESGEHAEELLLRERVGDARELYLKESRKATNIVLKWRLKFYEVGEAFKKGEMGLDAYIAAHPQSAVALAKAKYDKEFSGYKEYLYSHYDEHEAKRRIAHEVKDVILERRKSALQAGVEGIFKKHPYLAIPAALLTVGAVVLTVGTVASVMAALAAAGIVVGGKLFMSLNSTPHDIKKAIDRGGKPEEVGRDMANWQYAGNWVMFISGLLVGGWMRWGGGAEDTLVASGMTQAHAQELVHTRVGALIGSDNWFSAQAQDYAPYHESPQRHPYTGPHSDPGDVRSAQRGGMTGDHHDKPHHLTPAEQHAMDDWEQRYIRGPAGRAEELRTDVLRNGYDSEAYLERLSQHPPDPHNAPAVNQYNIEMSELRQFIHQRDEALRAIDRIKSLADHYQRNPVVAEATANEMAALLQKVEVINAQLGEVNREIAANHPWLLAESVTTVGSTTHPQYADIGYRTPPHGLHHGLRGTLPLEQTGYEQMHNIHNPQELQQFIVAEGGRIRASIDHYLAELKTIEHKLLPGNPDRLRLLGLIDELERFKAKIDAMVMTENRHILDDPFLKDAQIGADQLPREAERFHNAAWSDMKILGGKSEELMDKYSLTA